MKTYWNTQGGLSQINEWQPNSWIQVTCPTESLSYALYYSTPRYHPQA